MTNRFKLALAALLAMAGLAFTASQAYAALTLGATSASSDGALTVDLGATSAFSLGPSLTSGTVVLGGTAQTGSLTVSSSSGTSILNLGVGSGATTVNIGTAAVNAKTINLGTGAVANTVTIGSTSGAALTTLQGGTGGIVLSGSTTLTSTLVVNASSTAATSTVRGIIVLKNADFLDNNTDGTFGLNRNTDADVTLQAADSSGATNFVVDTTGAGAITIGSADVTSITLTTDNTGDGTDVVLPAGAVATAEILNDTITASDTAATLAFDDGDFLNLSSINNSATTEGLRLPQAADVSAGTAEGQISWDTDGDTLYVGTGAGIAAISPSTASNNTWTGTNTFSATTTLATTSLSGGLSIATGGLQATSTTNAASTIALVVNGGTSETIKIQSVLGTGAASLNLLSTAGGITLNGSTGITLTAPSTTLSGSLVLQNSEFIQAATDGQFLFGRNDAGTVTITAADNDATAALTITSGGAAILRVDTGGAAALQLGNTNANGITLGNSGATTTNAGALSVTGTTTLLGVLTMERASGTVVTNAVTLNTISGKISDDTDLVASSTRTAITLTNSRILAESLILINVCSTPSAGAMIGVSATPAAGQATITVWNASVIQTATYSLCFLVIN